MQINQRDLMNPFFIILFSTYLRSVVSQADLIPVDGSYSIIYTSQLEKFSRSFNLLKLENFNPPDCVTTLDDDISWILVDLGFTVSGIVQLRLNGDIYNENTYKYLSNMEIKVAERLPLKNVSNFAQFEDSFFKTCGNIGTVSQQTFNVVVECKSEFSARWILFKSKRKLCLCLITVLTKAVERQCFFPLEHDDSLYSTVSSKLEVFRHISQNPRTECFRKCINEKSCQGIAYTPDTPETGHCQLIKVKSQAKSFICDKKCILSLNLCHLGQKFQVRPSNRVEIIKLPPIKKNSIVLSIQINGEMSCNYENCGLTNIFIIDANERINLCTSIDPLLFRILVNIIFLCKQIIRDPVELVFKSEYNNSSYYHKFYSIYLRTVSEHSFIVDIFKIHQSIDLTTTTSSTAQTSSTVITTSPSNVFSSTTSFKSSTSTISSTASQESKSSTTRNNYPTPTIKSVFNINPLKKSTYKISSTQESHKFYSHTIFKVESFGKSKFSIKTDLENVSESGKFEKREQEESTSILPRKSFSTSIGNTKKIFISTTNQSVIVKPMATSQSTPPYIWIILLIFVCILVLVTAIVLLVTLLENRRKKKEWSLPPHGICPLDQGSEQITLLSSINDSTIRQGHVK